MKIEKLIKTLSELQTQYPNVEIIAPIGAGEHYLPIEDIFIGTFCENANLWEEFVESTTSVNVISLE